MHTGSLWIHKVSRWSEEWLLRFNPNKCKVMHIRHQFPTKYTIRQDDKDWTLQEAQEERDLGIITTADFKVSRQCTEAASKANKVLGMVSRQFKDLDKEGFLIIYKGYVRPHLEYAIQAWSPCILERRRQPFRPREGPKESDQISKRIQEVTV